MEAVAINLYDVLRRTMTEQAAKEMAEAVVLAARVEAAAVQKEAVQKSFPPLVEAAVATEIKHLATKEDIAVLQGKMELMATKAEMGLMERRIVYWVAGVIVSVLVATIAIISAIKTVPAPQYGQPPAPQATEASR